MALFSDHLGTTWPQVDATDGEAAESLRRAVQQETDRDLDGKVKGLMN